MSLSMLFTACLNIPYEQAGVSASYAQRRIGDALYLFFEGSDGENDWRRNLNFPAVPYKRMTSPVWYAHRGFLSVWKELEDVLAPAIADGGVKSITIVGYSHGAAVAMLCHEYAWFHRPDLRQQLQGYGFGCPRVFWGARTPSLLQRWERFTVVHNIDDVVSHLPPSILGYSHVGKLLVIGAVGKYSRVDAHRAENILRELEAYEEGGEGERGSAP
ncbi:MAG: lipase family protein [Clostridia bacterium]|nr:lipase family protein [Clostridia bacterium]